MVILGESREGKGQVKEHKLRTCGHGQRGGVDCWGVGEGRAMGKKVGQL